MKIILLIVNTVPHVFIAIIASKGSVAAVSKVFYLVILLKLSYTTIRNLMCAMLPDCTVYELKDKCLELGTNPIHTKARNYKTGLQH